MRQYRFGGTPWIVIIDKKGVVRYNDFHISVKDASKLINALKLEKVPAAKAKTTRTKTTTRTKAKTTIKAKK